MRIPIAVKIITLTILIVVGATALVTRQSSEFLKSVMVQREDYANLTETTLRAKQVDGALDSAFERAKSVTSAFMKMQPEEILNAQMPKEKNLVAFEVYRMTGGVPELWAKKTSLELLQKKSVTELDFESSRKKNPFPIHLLIQKQIELKFSNIKPDHKIITFGFPLAKDASDAVTFFAIVDFEFDIIQGLFAGESEREFYVVQKSGELLVHQDEERAKSSIDWATYPIVQKSLSDSSPRKQITFVDPGLKKTYIGAYVKSANWGVTVLAQTAQDIILEPAREVQRKAIFISGIVISVSLFIVFLFSLTLTGPIEKLADLIKEISKGNFDVKATSQVKTHDEVGDLATAFDHMTEGLKERDKVKNLFSKFHGSSVAENLIANEIGVGGTRKEVTVFFSDIRGFTKFSEGHSPEEVVTMLNEYFGVMVGIINKHGGVVDKFIGDAIMAVWGAPHATEKDTSHAVTACLEMRRALGELNKSRGDRGLSAIMIGMGLHAGTAISGTIGSEERMEYTVIGDTVNMTSRIESTTKVYGTDLLVSDEVFDRVKDEFGLDLAGEAEVKGKAKPLKLYKVLGYRSADGGLDRIQTPYSDYEAEHDDKVKKAG